MSVDLITLIVFGLFFFLLAAETPVSFALAASGGVGIALLRDAELATSVLGSVPFNETHKYSLAIIPMYILLGMFALHGRLAERVYSAATVALRRLPGGLGIATVGACAGFAAVSGSSVATAASIGKISAHEMMRHGYKAPFAGGIVAVAGTLGILIPPSVALVLYGVIARESIADLLMAGVVPGIVAALAYAAFIAARARQNVVPGQVPLAQALAAAGGKAPSAADEEQAEVTNFQRFRATAWIAAIFAAILLGMLTGLFTVIESAAIGALIALVMLVSENLRSGLRPMFSRARGAVLEAASVTSMAFALVVGAGVLSTFLVMARIPMQLTQWVVGFDVPGWVIVVGILAVMVPLGMFLETLSILVIVVPLVHPVITELGYDGVWFGVLFVMMLEIGLVTPPVGMNTFVVSMTSGLRLESVFRGVTPFVFVSLAVVAAVFVVPDIALWLPGLLAE
ncbi:TRAP transporter large permease [Blastococcus mobilis]|uniref:TRAP transporter, DctM subunit n=1 Tax=Blastococcus mobilis TaxID=1938746 RepID=A0A238ZDA7_9ACTN|nr:TRAP transporter large permease [Blastococcus mobilis]SNR81069.1 TRAP transporter, DctM subunit [Blastococcus mobilis]